MLTDWRMYLIYGRSAVLDTSDKIYTLSVGKCHWDSVGYFVGHPRVAL